MLELGLILLAVLVLALVVQERFKVPLPVSVLTLVMSLAAFNIHLIDLDGHLFDQMLLLMLPVLLTVDILHLQPKELKEHWISVLATAGIAVILSVVTGVLFQTVILPDYDIPVAAMVALMTMVVATDPVTVAAVFGNYKLPHRLKFLAEAESLHNDATAFIIFSVAVLLMTQDMTVTEITAKGIATLAGALGIGLAAGGVGVYLLKLSNDPVTEAFIILMVAMGSFAGAEHFHFAGIFAVVVSVVLMNALIHKKQDSVEEDIKDIKQEAGSVVGRFAALEHLVHTLDNHKQIVGYIGFVAIIANTVLFISMAELINFDLLVRYWKEILAVFVATTVIRGAMMGLFAHVSNGTKKMQDVNRDWWAVLTFAGVKGGLSILMLHMLPKDFEYLELFEAIVIGNIILSTFIYSLVLSAIIKFRGGALSPGKELA